MVRGGGGLMGSHVFFVFFNLAVPALSCGTGGLQSSLQHVRSLPASRELLVVACGI